ncbi:MAG: 1,4-alpha-glucan branching protein GlgB [Christensenellales bacterium]
MPKQIDEVSAYLFHQGTNAYAYRVFGCHFDGHRHWFTVWAPSALRVSVVGSFNAWDANANPMEKTEFEGIWTCSIEGLQNGMLYKYAVTSKEGNTVLKADPYAFASEFRPSTASKIWDLHGYAWHDRLWQKKKREQGIPYQKPVSIYEVHLGSWRGEGFQNYRDIANELVPYVKEMGFTHIELMPVAEYPLDDSWGYQVTGYYAPTARYGTPQDFMYFVDLCHQQGIGVLLDWVGAHFPKDESGLYRFDGSALYEYDDPRRGEQPQWGTCLFRYDCGGVKSFLISNAVYWLEQYHIDGLRVDAVTSMLYLNYGKKDGEWLPNRYGGFENLDAIGFLKDLNTTVEKEFPSTCMIAEESTAFPLVTRSVFVGGLGFSFKWNMGFMNDVLEYMKEEYSNKKYCHHKITFSMWYAFSENFILPFSHDEVVHGKKAMLDKMAGDYWQKFAALKTLLAYTFAHPGKKLLFMGTEIGQFIEWRYYEPLEWKLLCYESHASLQLFVKKLNLFYRNHPAFFKQDGGWDGFQWLTENDTENSVVAFMRRESGGEEVLCIFNFTPDVHASYRIGVPKGEYRLVLCSDGAEYGGSGYPCKKHAGAADIPCNNENFSINLTIPPLCAMFYKRKNQAALQTKMD